MNIYDRQHIDAQALQFESAKHHPHLPVRDESVVRSHGTWSEQMWPQSAQAPLESHCLTCSDEAQSARVVSMDDETGFALVESRDQLEKVDVSLVEHVAPGDRLLVHGGIALGHPEEIRPVR